MVWMIKRDARSNQFGSSMVMVNISSMNLSLDDYVASMSTDSFQIFDWFLSHNVDLFLKQCMCGDQSDVSSHDFSLSGSFPMTIPDSFMVVYSASAGVFPNNRLRQSRNKFFTMEIHVDYICVLACIRRYAVSRYVFPISINLVGHLSCIAAIMWIILSRHN